MMIRLLGIADRIYYAAQSQTLRSFFINAQRASSKSIRSSVPPNIKALTSQVTLPQDDQGKQGPFRAQDREP